MKVRELQKALSKLPPDMDILCWTEDEAIVPRGHLFRLLNVESVETVKGERTRDDDLVPTLKLQDSDESEVVAILNVTSDF